MYTIMRCVEHPWIVIFACNVRLLELQRVSKADGSREGVPRLYAGQATSEGWALLWLMGHRAIWRSGCRKSFGVSGDSDARRVGKDMSKCPVERHPCHF